MEDLASSLGCAGANRPESTSEDTGSLPTRSWCGIRPTGGSCHTFGSDGWLPYRLHSETMSVSGKLSAFAIRYSVDLRGIEGELSILLREG